ncbi:hypothetical protein [Burkholderia ubonensis]|uniref:hypothetical protein n=1 Tax=Burkholderia ubonensis TaxID=101571 RepID=UPI0011613F18|nr:hypothetical protein [Burkholderia ubonensis]
MILLSAVGLLMTGCVSVTDPVAMGEGRYLITLNARGGLQSDGELLAQSVQRANDFCAARGLHADVVSTQTSGVQMWTPQNNQVIFKCVS